MEDACPRNLILPNISLDQSLSFIYQEGLIARYKVLNNFMRVSRKKN